ncbi:HEL163Cp [Eremothecium sinecaudum]|uniref:Protein ARV n=1 Tax=Eremothecium sinecaudum TaxID=45286 RepID=A0A109UZI1_9SACH|nr:HEL163Cp [Eremothecium sinecaudum]AMD21118.1 HEL163Cp [Eremothecium sinecaudum]
MICINCGNHVDTLYVMYSGNHIRLTDCSNCHMVVDQYVEFDNVLLFINLLLLKPDAYRHLVFNSLEMGLRDYPDYFDYSKGRTWLIYAYNWIIWLKKFDRLNRIWLLLITFEVYLTWATAEKKCGYYQNYVETYNAKLITYEALSMRSPLYQYTFFAFYVLGDLTCLHKIVHYYLLRWSKWGSQYKYAKDIISYTMLLSYGAKIFPILMLIWPYDGLVSTSIIKWIANIYIIESLKIVTNKPYLEIVTLVCFVSLIRCVTVKPIMAFLISKGNITVFLSYLQGELGLFKYRFLTKRDIFL